MAEEWRTYYKGPRVTWEVSNEGRVKKNGELYKPKIYKGYLMVGHYAIHRMVAQCFIPNPDNKPCVDHINGNRQDNRVTNLRWCTSKENNNNPITRKRLSESRKGKPSWNRGKKLDPQSEEHKKRRSESLKGIPPSNKGKHRVYDENDKYHYE